MKWFLEAKGTEFILSGVIARSLLRDQPMIISFRSKALRRFWEDGDRRGLRPDLVERISDLLDVLDLAEAPAETNVGGARFHDLRGKPKRFALAVNRNWRITFGWSGQHAVDVDLEDYH